MSFTSFKRKWNGKAVQDDGCYISKEGKSFVTTFRNMLRAELPDTEVIDLTAGHYYCSGFLKRGDRIMYVSYNIPRYGERIDFNKCGTDGVLYRTAKDLKDYTGGVNNFCSLDDLIESLNSFFAVPEGRWH